MLSRGDLFLFCNHEWQRHSWSVRNDIWTYQRNFSWPLLPSIVLFSALPFTRLFNYVQWKCCSLYISWNRNKTNLWTLTTWVLTHVRIFRLSKEWLIVFLALHEGDFKTCSYFIDRAASSNGCSKKIKLIAKNAHGWPRNGIIANFISPQNQF